MFDFFLLLLSYFGLVAEFIAGSQDASSGSDNDVSDEARLFRFNRLLRVLRVLRLFRLFKFSILLQAAFFKDAVSFAVAEHLKSISICRAFVQAHLHAQKEMILFFGDNGKVSGPECARVLLESQTEVYKACAIAAAESDNVDPTILAAVKLLRQSSETVAMLTAFVVEAHEKGVISGREAETITHTLDHHVMEFSKTMRETMDGRTHSKDKEQGDAAEQLGGHTAIVAPAEVADAVEEPVAEPVSPTGQQTLIEVRPITPKDDLGIAINK